MDVDVVEDAAGRGDGETMRGLCCLGVVHAAVCWGRLRSAGGTSAAPTTYAIVYLARRS